MRKSGGYAKSFHTGEAWIDAFNLGPGEEEEFIIEMALQRDGMSKDWSVTAWGENGSVKVTVGGLTSDSFPYIKRNDSYLPQDEGRSGEQSSTESEESEEEASESQESDEENAVPECDFLEYDEYLHFGCTTLERILREYSNSRIYNWLMVGDCSDFDERWKKFSLDGMTYEQIQQMFSNLDVPENLSGKLMERGEDCSFAPSEKESESDESEEEEESSEEEVIIH